MTSQDRRYQDNRYQQDDDYRRERWRDERDGDNRRYQGSERDFREAPSGRGRENHPEREGRWQDQAGRQSEFPGNRFGYVNRGRFEERDERWDRDPGRERGDFWRERDLDRSAGPYGRGQRGADFDEPERGGRGYYIGQQRPLWDRAGEAVSRPGSAMTTFRGASVRIRIATCARATRESAQKTTGGRTIASVRTFPIA
jgi:hypothetical protein